MAEQTKVQAECPWSGTVTLSLRSIDVRNCGAKWTPGCASSRAPTAVGR